MVQYLESGVGGKETANDGQMLLTEGSSEMVGTITKPQPINILARAPQLDIRLSEGLDTDLLWHEL